MRNIRIYLTSIFLVFSVGAAARASVIVNPAATTSVTTNLSQNVSFSSTSLYGVVGSTVADNAATGNVGEYIESQVANLSITPSGTTVDATSIILTRGDWEISIQGEYTSGGSTSLTLALAWISTTSGNNFTELAAGVNSYRYTGAAFTGSFNLNLGCANVRVEPTTTTTYYYKVFTSFTSSAPNLNGVIRARRMR